MLKILAKKKKNIPIKKIFQHNIKNNIKNNITNNIKKDYNFLRNNKINHPLFEPKNNFNDYIPITKIYYINLNDRIDRRNIFEDFYSKQNFQPIRFTANKITLQIFQKKYPELAICKFITQANNIKWINGTLGCYDSHYSILKNNVNNINFKFLVILEDDCTISKNDLNKCINFLEHNQHIDVLRINCWLSIPNNPHKLDTINKYSRYYDGNNKKYFDGGTHCCIYLTKNIPNIINFLKRENVFQIDAVLSNKLINSVVYKIPNTIKYTSKSSIQDEKLTTKSQVFLKLKRRKRL